MSFDPYSQWLEIPPGDRPPDHYSLLGLPAGDASPEQITSAADERMARVRTFQTGPRSIESQRLLNELAAARLCLLNPATKATYDAVLEGKQRVTRRDPPPLAAGRLTGFQPVSMRDPTDRLETCSTPHPPLAETVEAESAIRRLAGRAWFWPAAAFGAILIAAATWVGRDWIRGQLNEAANPDSQVGLATGEPSVEDTASKRVPQEPAARRDAVQQPADGSVDLPAEAAQPAGAAVLTEGVVAGWTSSGDTATWGFHIQRPGVFAVELEYASATSSPAGDLTVSIGEESRRAKVLPTGGWDQFARRTAGYLPIRSAGRHRLIVSAAQQANEPPLRLKSARLRLVQAAIPKRKSPRSDE